MAFDSSILETIIGSIIIVFGSWLSTFSLGKLIQGIATRAGAHHGMIQSIRDFMLVAWVMISASGVAAYTGLASQFTALTISGSAGLVISLALQSTISNIISGIYLLSDGAVRVDDEIEYSGIKGIVVRTALGNMWIRTDQGNIAIIGNTTLSGGPLINHSAKERLTRKAMAR